MSKIEVRQLQSIRRDNILFQDISFQLDEGELLQIDGINGSGKSTMLRICAGLTQATEGNVYWNNENINDCRYQYQSAITYIGHTNGVKDALTAKENIKIINVLSACKNKFDPNNVLEQIGLPDMEDILLSKMSVGQKRRIALTRLIIDSSKLWLLDEPFTSLDSIGKTMIEELIINHCQNKGMVIFATHQRIKIEGQKIRRIYLGK